MLCRLLKFVYITLILRNGFWNEQESNPLQQQMSYLKKKMLFNLFNIHLDNLDTGMNSESSVGMNKDNQKLSSDRSRRSCNTPRSTEMKNQRASKKRNTGRGAEMDGLNVLLMTIAKRKSAELAKSTVTNKSEDNVSK